MRELRPSHFEKCMVSKLTTPAEGKRQSALRHFAFHLQREFRVDVTAVVASTMRELSVATLRAAHIVNGLERVMRATLALARFADPLDRLHDRLLCDVPHTSGVSRTNRPTTRLNIKSNGGLNPPLQWGWYVMGEAGFCQARRPSYHCSRPSFGGCPSSAGAVIFQLIRVWCHRRIISDVRGDH